MLRTVDKYHNGEMTILKHICAIGLLIFSSNVIASENLGERVKILEQKVLALEKLIKISPTTKPLTTSNNQTPKSNEISMTEWSYSYEKVRSSGYYNIHYSLMNSYDKDIKLIEGYIQFKDLLGENLFGIKITPDLKIVSGKTVKDGGSYRINRFINREARMKDMDKVDVVATLVIRKIVFSDNSILEM